MKRLARLAAWLGFAAFSAFATATAMAAGPSVNILKDTDLPGFDYQINKGVTLDQCQKACTGDNLCRAFTYNTKTKWCFLKSDVATPSAFSGATSGTLTLSPTPKRSARASCPSPPTI